jgi:hypothetical protein
MNQITLRGIPDTVLQRARREAKRSGTSLNRVLVALLEATVGGGGKGRSGKRLHHDLDDLAGSWPREEAEAFDQFIAAQRTVDGELWKP